MLKSIIDPGLSGIKVVLLIQVVFFFLTLTEAYSQSG